MPAITSNVQNLDFLIFRILGGVVHYQGFQMVILLTRLGLSYKISDHDLKKDDSMSWLLYTIWIPDLFDFQILPAI